MTGPPEIDDAAIGAGIGLAHLLGIPLNIGGRQVTVTAEMAAPFLNPPAAPSEPDPFYEPPSNLEVVRRAMWMVNRLETFINEAGVDLGLIEPLKPTEAAPPVEPISNPERQAECQPSIVFRRDGSVTVDDWLEVRSETGVAYHVVSLLTQNLVAWLPDKQKAIDHAVALAKKYPPPHKPGDKFTWQ